jgi:hypothetical protein
MKFCTECGQKLAGNQPFCTQCGKKISHATTPGEEIQRILAKPWSQVTVQERKILCIPDLGVAFGLGRGSSKPGIPDASPTSLPEQDIEITKTWVIPPHGCPVADHKFLDGQMVLASDTFEIPDGEFAGCCADGPSLFGLPELDDNCTCFMVAGVFESGTVLARSLIMEKPIIPNLVSAHQDSDPLNDLRSSNETLEIKTIPELNLAMESNPDNSETAENFGLSKSWTKAQKIRREIALEKAMHNFDRLSQWIPKYIKATDTAEFHRREKILGVLKRETTFVLNQIKNLGRFDYYELSMFQTLEKLNKYYDDALYGENTHHSQDVKQIIKSTKRKKSKSD